jgi:cell wall-associated NlpC family hydrolase
VSEPARDAIVARALSCLGTRFVWQGRQPGVGLDCIGLVLVAADNPRLWASDKADYALSVQPERLRVAIDRFGLQASSPARPGDLVLLTVRNAPLHLAIRSPGGLIHADMRLRRVVEHRLDASWQARIVQTYCLPGVN